MIAYQAYGAMLGVRLSAGSLQTGDVDIAQFKNVSVAVEDSTPPVLDVLKEVDKSVRAVPHVSDGPLCRQRRLARRLSYTPRGQGDQPAQKATALNTDAQPLRFLDFLIRDPEPRSSCTVPASTCTCRLRRAMPSTSSSSPIGARKGLQSVTRTCSSPRPCFRPWLKSVP